MSNFKCLTCGASIIEDEKGIYVTECKHHPLEETNKDKKGSHPTFQRLMNLFLDK